MADETKPKKAAAKKEGKPEGATAAAEPAPGGAAPAPTAAPAKAEGRPAKAKKPAAEGEAKAGAAPAPAAPAEVTAATAPTAAELLGEDQAAKKIIKAKGAKNIASGIANILATFNNTLVSITDMHGNVLGWSSSGRVGFKGSRKSTAYAAQQVAQDAARQAMAHGMKEIEVRV